MTKVASGPFTVALSPQPLSQVAEHTTISRMSLDKQFQGDL